MELTQLIQRAQEALDRGEHHVVAAACRHALATYPTCLGAHRLLGEAYLEQGQVIEAIEEFGITLALDPLDVVSSLGLGVAAEEQGDARAAADHYLSAWELNPSLDQLRDELIRLRKTFGGDERLYRTRAGLATVFTRTGQFGRAVSEWRAVYAADSENFRSRTALLEALWRHGDDAAARGLAREILARDPETVRALAILADIEHRRGVADATATAAKYRALDPTGEILTQLREAKPHANLTWLMPEPAMAPPFDLDAVAKTASAPVAAAVLMDAPLAAAAVAAATLATTEPSQHGAAPDLWENLVRDIGGDGGGGQGGELAPFAWSSADDSGQVFGLDPDLGDAMPFDASSFESGADSDDPLTSLFVADSVDTVPPPPAPVEPLPLTAAPAPPPSPALAGPEQFITADGRVDLTVGWDDLDRTLQEATPSGEAGEFSDLIAEFGVDGIAPFDPLDGDDNDAWSPFSEQDFAEWPEGAAGEPVVAADSGSMATDAIPAVDDLTWPDDMARSAEPVAPPFADTPPAPAVESPYQEMDAVTALTAGWDSIEDELAAAVPDDGFDEGAFDSLNDEGIVPFDFTSPADEVDPLANPDAVGDPLDFDDLLMVTSQDGTAPLSGNAPTADAVEPVSGWMDSSASAAAGAIDTGDESDTMAGVEPFAFDDTGLAPPSDAVDFSDVDQEVRPGLGAVVAGFDLFDEFDASADDRSVSDPQVEEAVTPWRDETPALEAEPPGMAAWTETGESLKATGASSRIDPVSEPTAVPSEPVAPVNPIEVSRAAHSATPPTPVITDSTSRWPAFVSGTSELVDRFGELGVLFARLREEKESLMGLGMARVDRSILRPPSATVSHETFPPPVASSPSHLAQSAPTTNHYGPDHVTAKDMAAARQVVALPSLVHMTTTSADPGGHISPIHPERELASEISQWRARLREGRNEAAEVVSVIEQQMATGPQEPALLRVLGEAYLRLGRSDLAAAQFRAASARRVRRA